MSKSKLPIMPQIGQTATFKPLPLNDILMSGKVQRIIETNADGWKVEIFVDRLSGSQASSFEESLDQLLTFEHFKLVAIEGNKEIFPLN